uniref:Variant surface glycoprotein 802 n=1 Tax=Trypanosoma brucei TaxID=5691 RepID=M4T0R7_9TRYP|nr:variant surface glycoprotein 802 [Trypanosoma brucei]
MSRGRTTTGQTKRFLILILAVFHTTDTDAAHSMGILKTSWQPLCEATANLNAIPSNVNANLKTATTQVMNMLQEALRAGIYAKMHKASKTAKQATIVQAYLTSAAMAGLQQLSAMDITNGIDLVAKATYLKGDIDTFLNLAANIKQDTEGCLVTTATTVLSAWDKQSADGTPCPTTLQATTTTQTALRNLKHNGHSGAADTNNNGDQHQAANTANCRLFSPTNANGLGKSGAIAADFYWAGGYYKVAATTDARLTIADLRSAAALSTTEQKPWADVFTALNTEPKATHNSYKNITQQLETDDRATNLLGRIYKNDGSKTKEDVKTDRTALFGDTSADQHRKIFGTINDDKITTKIAGLAAGTQLGTITDGNDLAAMLAVLELANMDEVQALKKKLEEQKDQQQTVSETTCNKIKVEADCNKTAICSFNKTETDENKKCQLDAKKALATGVPVTQTQTTETTAASDRCTKHTKKEECETENKNVKAGEKTVCGWIEEKCKDSSFLVNKQFAIMVYAFVTLLFVFLKIPPH